MQRILPVLALTLVATVGVAQAQNYRPVPYTIIHDKPTTEFPFEVELLPEKSSFMVGEPIFLTFRVKNPSERHWTVLHGGDSRNMYGRPESFTLSATTADGTVVKQLDGGMQFGGMFTGSALPQKSHFDFALFLPSWLELKTPGKYRIQVSRLLQFSTAYGDLWATPKNTSSFKSEAGVEVEVLPRDEAKLGTLIQEWITTLSEPFNEGKSSALTKIRSIQDNRALPFLVQAARNYADDTLCTAALTTLGKYNDETAVAPLSDAMQVKSKDIAPTYSDNMKAETARRLRHVAATSLSQNAHPKAWQILQTHLHDDYYAVRLTVVQRAVKQPLKEAEPILRAMFTDENTMVRDEAQRLWKLLHPTP